MCLISWSFADIHGLGGVRYRWDPYIRRKLLQEQVLTAHSSCMKFDIVKMDLLMSPRSDHASKCLAVLPFLWRCSSRSRCKVKCIDPKRSILCIILMIISSEMDRIHEKLSSLDILFSQEYIWHDHRSIICWIPPKSDNRTRSSDKVVSSIYRVMSKTGIQKPSLCTFFSILQSQRAEYGTTSRPGYLRCAFFTL